MYIYISVLVRMVNLQPSRLGLIDSIYKDTYQISKDDLRTHKAGIYGWMEKEQFRYLLIFTP
jgi:hypothetical protein